MNDTNECWKTAFDGFVAAKSSGGLVDLSDAPQRMPLSPLTYPEETRPPAPEEWADTVHSILEWPSLQDPRELIAIAVDDLDSAGLRLPESVVFDVVSTLIDGPYGIGVLADSVPRALRNVLEEKATAVVAQNTKWRCALDLGDSDDDLLHTMDLEPGEKINLDRARQMTARLRTLRADDPDRARSLLHRLVGISTPRERAEFLGIWASNPPPTTEDLKVLEQFRNDDKDIVRRRADYVLRMIPGSSVAADDAERLPALLSAVTGSEEVQTEEIRELAWIIMVTEPERITGTSGMALDEIANVGPELASAVVASALLYDDFPLALRHSDQLLIPDDAEWRIHPGIGEAAVGKQSDLLVHCQPETLFTLAFRWRVWSWETAELMLKEMFALAEKTPVANIRRPEWQWIIGCARRAGTAAPTGLDSAEPAERIRGLETPDLGQISAEVNSPESGR